MSPHVKDDGSCFEQRHRSFGLLEYCVAKIPGLRHIDVVLRAMYAYNNVQLAAFKELIQEKLHQLHHTESHNIFRGGVGGF